MIRIIISGGGTGGHVFPAIAIANALRDKVKDIGILFIGARGRLEMEKVPAAGYAIEGLAISGFQRRITWKNLVFPFKLAASLLKARLIIARFRPDVVIGVGGYASGPTLRMAASMGIPALIQEQNSFPGVTNRLLGSKVQRICVAYDGMNKYFPENKIVFTGNPVRQDVINISGKRDEAALFFGLNPAKSTLLVIGGSLGAGTINRAIQKFVMESLDESGIQVIWQTGKCYFETVKENLKDSKIPNPKSEIQNVVLLPFIDRMDLAYAAADIIVSRAGAIAISELCAVGKPVILVPSPNVAEDHQMKNARALESRRAALIIPDSEAVDRLGQTILQILRDAALQSELMTNIARLGITDAAVRIAEESLSLIKTKDEIKNPKSEIRIPNSVYFLGIGGIGMSALARYFSLMGAKVSGYDRTPTALTGELAREGMEIHFSADTSLIPPDPDLVIYTPAIPPDHPELLHFREHGIPVKKRAEVLGLVTRDHRTIAVAGTHGKTTTSTMIAHLLRTAGIGQMAFLGGISKNYGTNFLHGTPGGTPAGPGIRDPGYYCVAEADEYDRSFLQLSPYLAVITSADADHLEIYGNQDIMRSTFTEFTSRIVPGGSLLMKSGIGIAPAETGVFTRYGYSFGAGTDFYLTNTSIENGLPHFDFVNPAGQMKGLVLGVPGKFNLENALAALSVGYLLGIDERSMKEALLTYQGVRRRFEFMVRKPGLVYIDDYAHHPREIAACISAARDLYPAKKITGIFQPHLFSRTRDLADDFARSLEMLDELILLDIYPARELPVEGVTSQMLLDRVVIKRKKLVRKDELLHEIREQLPEVLITMGAGDIDQLAGPLAGMLEEINI